MTDTKFVEGGWNKKKDINEYLEKVRQSDFKKEQSCESVFTRPFKSIVDVDN